MTDCKPAGCSSHSAKRDGIVDAAQRLFLRQGYSGTSMDAIAAEAGVAKQTVYNHFGTKEDLFIAIIRSRCVHMTQLLGDGAEDGAPGEVLRRFAYRYFDMLLSDEAIALNRTLMAEIPRMPELGRLWFEAGPARACDTLAAYFQHQRELGRFDMPKPRIVAEQFFGILGGFVRLRYMAMPDAKPTRKEIEQYVGTAVDTILKAYARPEVRD